MLHGTIYIYVLMIWIILMMATQQIFRDYVRLLVYIFDTSYLYKDIFSTSWVVKCKDDSICETGMGVAYVKEFPIIQLEYWYSNCVL
jgi:hypothetical protein